MKMNEMLHRVKATATRVLQVLALAQKISLLHDGETVGIERNGENLEISWREFACTPAGQKKWAGMVARIPSLDSDDFDPFADSDDFDPFADESEPADIRDACGLRRVGDVIMVSDYDSSRLSRALAASGPGVDARLN